VNQEHSRILALPVLTPLRATKPLNSCTVCHGWPLNSNPVFGETITAVKVLVAGASGVIGIRLVPLLIGSGYEVFGVTRTPSKTEMLRSTGASPVVCDVYERDPLRTLVRAIRPDVVVDQLTDLPDNAARIQEYRAATRRMQREGTGNLLEAARDAGVTRYLAQSIAWKLPEDSGAAVLDRERAVLDAGGVVLRYGQFYGPGTYWTTRLPPPPRIHVDEAAHETLRAIHAPSGVVTLVESDGLGGQTQVR